MKERIKDKILEIEEFVEFLIKRVPANLEEYKINLEKKAVCERYAEKIIEALVDLAFLVVKELRIEIPAQASDTEIFNVLEKNDIISTLLSKSLQDAKGMRNIIAHEYGKIDDEIIFEAVSSELGKDAKEFISNITKRLK